MIAGLTKAYEQLDTHPAIKIAIQPMMDKLRLYCDAALRKPIYQPGSEGTSESDPWELTGAATDPFNIQDEVNSYLTAPTAYKNTHILDWWQLNATQFLNIAIASQAILAVPAISVPSECAFSAGGQTCDNLRGSLKAGTIAAQPELQKKKLCENRFNNPNQNCWCSPHPHDQNHEESASFRWRPSGAARGAPRGQGFRTDALKAQGKGLGRPGLAAPGASVSLCNVQMRVWGFTLHPPPRYIVVVGPV
ncbi:hypothetical protein CROQUDRAFT_93902 [Cronartium quercuum f. sp. fusiforme G11]|uniref:HAT C-terminal dimerisation domain-containing protein n=1 Tax=Cronartium quercuum f. sp. fusiforme G11 TaxID=708437 RepID=A0A9P6NJZ3_9BASI|nr:hypothetical protein CROQUDRAFT_93902 [Cronartium quercuum f. sp. fusiforme G11]